MSVAMAMYCPEGSMARTRPMPDQAGLITQKDMQDLSKEPQTWVVPIVAKTLETVWKTYRPLLAAKLPLHLVREEIVSIGSLVVRCLFGKTLESEGSLLFPGGRAVAWTTCPVASGKVTQEKLNKVLGWWAHHVDDVYPELNFSADAELTSHLPPLENMRVPADDVFHVPAKRLRGKTPSNPKDPEEAPLAPLAASASDFKVGDIVALKARITKTMAIPGNPNFRKDMREGTEGKVLSLASGVDKPRVEVLFEVMHKGTSMELTASVMISVLTLASDATQKVDAATGSDKPLADAIVNGSAFGKQVEKVPEWSDLLDHDSPQAHMATLKAKAMFAMSHILEFMPSYDESELLVVHRANAAGAKRTEVWTNRVRPWRSDVRTLDARGQRETLHHRPLCAPDAPA